MTSPRAIVVADDLTGAADAGAPFAAAGFTTVVPLRSTPDGAEVISLSNNTRDASGDRIERLFQQSMVLLPPANSATVWYAKVDSVFRGYPGPQVAFLLRQTARRAVVIAPALPDQRRVTVDGDVYVDDELLTESPLGIGHSSSSVVELLGLPEELGRTVGLEVVRSGAPALRTAIERVVRPIVVVDAETNADLATLASAVVENRTLLLAGSAGFSKQLAVRMSEQAGRMANTAPRAPVQSVLTVAGSRHLASEKQVAALAESGVTTIRINFEQGHLAPQVTERMIEKMIAAFSGGRSVTLTTCETPRSSMPGHEIAHALAALATDPRVRNAYDAMILTGGDVASAVCARLEADAIWLGGEVLPAIPWGALHGGLRPGLPIVTKAGSFGDGSAMVEAAAFLTQTTN
jgi:uncharacterized protein YgbK (DUF1537 family)